MNASIMKRSFVAAVALALLAACTSRRRAPQIPTHGVIGVTDAHLDPEYWISARGLARRCSTQRRSTTQNAKLHKLDRSVHDIEALMRTLPRPTCASWIEELSERPDDKMYDEQGRAVAASASMRSSRT